MAVRTDSEITTNRLPDNNTGDISAADVRDAFETNSAKSRKSLLQWVSDNTGATDVTSEFLTAVGTGEPLYAPPGTYYINVTGLNTSINLVGAGPETVFVSDWNQYILNVNFPFTSGPHTLSDVSNVTYGTDDIVTRLTTDPVDRVGNFAEGDVVRVVSDDYMPHGGTRCSEIGRVMAIDGTNGYVYIHGRLQLVGNYTTNIKIYKLDNTKSVYLSDIAFGKKNDPFGTSPGGDREDSVEIHNVIRPYLNNIHVVAAERSGIVIAGCYRAYVDATVKNVPNNPTDDAYGYGAVAYGANFGCYFSLNGETCRHLFTTTSNDGTLGDELQGAPVGTYITGIGHNTYGETFDTHEEAIYTVFENCMAISPRQGDGPIIGKGFQDRGRDTTFRNCTAIDCSGGSFDINGHGVDHGGHHTTSLIGCEIRHTYFEIYDNSINIAGGTGFTKGVVNIVGLTSNNTQRVLEIAADGPVVNLSGAACSGIQSGGALARLNTNTNFRVMGVTLDYSDGGGGDCIEMEGTAQAHVNGLTIISDGTHPGEVFRDEDAGSHTYSATNVVAIGGTVSLDDGSGTFTVQTNEIA